MLNTFYFVRHGITNFNKDKKYTGHQNIELSASAYVELKNMLPMLKNKHISVIYSSPLLRTQQTAKIISNYLNISIVIVDEFKERNFGLFEGRRKMQYKKKCFPKGQTLYSYRKQILRGLKKVKIEDNALIVGHSGTFKVLIKYCYGVNFKNSISNNKLIYFDLKAKFPIDLNDTYYLKSLKSNRKRLDDTVIEIESLKFSKIEIFK
jgi:broad specificity phosphatase PhoE